MTPVIKCSDCQTKFCMKNFLTHQCIPQIQKVVVSGTIGGEDKYKKLGLKMKSKLEQMLRSLRMQSVGNKAVSSFELYRN